MDSVLNILIFHIGSLGDTLVSVPAVRAVREHFEKARITLLSDTRIGGNYVQAREVLDGSGLIDDWMTYPVANSAAGGLLKPLWMLRLLAELRLRRFDTLVYLVGSRRSDVRVSRDAAFFRLAGIGRMIGTRGFYRFPVRGNGRPLPRVPHQSDQILARLAFDKIPTGFSCNGKMGIRTVLPDDEGVDAWLQDMPTDGGRSWIGVGPGSKMPSKRWPNGRYAALISRLIDECDVWPVVFGGPEDEMLGRSLVEKWGRGYAAAGKLNIRQGIAALKRCRLYIGNDTGTMHMAVAAGCRCVALFSARDYPGNWYPYGSGHVIFRTQMPCEGCLLESCDPAGSACLLSINVDEVFYACSNILSRSEPNLGAGNEQTAKEGA